MSTTRSLRRSGGRLTVRRSTASWWRSTAFSTSSAATDELPPRTRSRHRAAKCTRKKTISRSYGPPDPYANQSFRALHARGVEIGANGLDNLVDGLSRGIEYHPVLFGRK